ncbi:hypothetical protein FRB95_003092 [Tulasnella sp. JGI-2019a]|nr:hypothetical protein FRB95_003092 [Tulasnella sp. JGI-2019a]
MKIIRAPHFLPSTSSLISPLAHPTLENVVHKSRSLQTLARTAQVTEMTQRPPHPALFVDEIVIQFLAYLYQPRFDNDYSDINAAGLICKAWRELSLDIKWREVDLKYLLSVLAPLRKPHPNEALFFTGVPTDADIYSFRDAARRVWYLKGDCNEEQTVLSKRIVNTIRAIQGDAPSLFPNLRTVKIGIQMHLTAITRFIKLLPPSLQLLDISTTLLSDDGYTVFLRSLPSRLPSLTTLTILGSAKAQANSAMCGVLAQSPELRHVSLAQHLVSSPLIEALSKLQFLESIEIGTAIDKMVLTGFEWERRFGAFPRLIELSARLPLDPPITSLLMDIGANHSLITLRLIYTGRNIVRDTVDFKSLMRAVATHSLLRHLSLIRFRADISNADILRPIACLTLLESLHIHTYPTSGITDKDVGELLENLPLLRHLQLYFPNWRERGWTRITLRTLALACAYCPLLENATLYVDARQESIPSEAQEQPMELKPRVVIFECATNDSYSAISAPEKVAAFLSQLRPVDV